MLWALGGEAAGDSPGSKERGERAEQHSGRSHEAEIELHLARRRSWWGLMEEKRVPVRMWVKAASQHSSVTGEGLGIPWRAGRDDLHPWPPILFSGTSSPNKVGCSHHRDSPMKLKKAATEVHFKIPSVSPLDHFAREFRISEYLL